VRTAVSMMPYSTTESPVCAMAGRVAHSVAAARVCLLMLIMFVSSVCCEIRGDGASLLHAAGTAPPV
jgi:hypothetical protein